MVLEDTTMEEALWALGQVQGPCNITLRPSQDGKNQIRGCFFRLFVHSLFIHNHSMPFQHFIHIDDKEMKSPSVSREARLEQFCYYST